MRIPTIALALLAGTAVACDNGDLLTPPASLSHAVASASCGPADGPAVSVLLTSRALESTATTEPHVRLNIWHPAAELVGTWSLAGSSTDGSAARIGTGGFVDGATQGSVAVLSVETDGTVVGNVDVILASGDRVRGGFRARWIATAPMCG